MSRPITYLTYPLLVSLWLLAASSARAQTIDDTDANALFDRSLQQYEDGGLVEADSLLGILVQNQPGFITATNGSVAYWKGRIQKELEDHDGAHQSWRAGIRALNDLGLVDARLADVFVRSTFEHHHVADYVMASFVFLQLLQFADGHQDPILKPLLRQHLLEMVHLLPGSLRHDLQLFHPFEEDWAADAGSRLTTWWRGKDVKPATRENERLIEHLQRVAVVRERYRPFDDIDIRGEIYLQLGEPSTILSIDFDTREFREKVVDRSITMQMSDFPRNEVWLYHHIDDRVVFIFLQENGRYRLGEVRDLIPSRLMTGLGGSSRGQAKARAVVRTLEQIYRQLSAHNRHFVDRYTEVLSVTHLLDEQDMLSDSGEVGSEYAQVQIAPEAEDPIVSLTTGGMTTRPDLFAQESLNLAHAEDGVMLAEREKRMEEPYTNTFDSVELGTMPVLALRFLDGDGTTRTEVYWGIPPGLLAPSRRFQRRLETEADYTDDYLLVESVVQRDSLNFERVVQQDRFILEGVAVEESASLAPRVVLARGDVDTYHIAGQWDIYPTYIRFGELESREQPIKTFVVRLDSMQGLRSDDLEMSDLEPIYRTDLESDVFTTQAASEAIAYPFTVLRGDGILWLYFEVYGLDRDKDGESQFDVTYTVGPEGGSASEITSVTTSYRSRGSIARELSTLDLAEWRGEGEIRVDVDIRDRLTRKIVGRSTSLRIEE